MNDKSVVERTLKLDNEYKRSFEKWKYQKHLLQHLAGQDGLT